MTTHLESAPAPLSSTILGEIADRAEDLDNGSGSTRDNIELLARHGLLGLGAPDNRGGALPEMAATLAELAGHCLSTAFSAWAHRMTVEYLAAAATSWSRETAAVLERGAALGVTGMASAFKDAAGCGSIDLSATPHGDGVRLNGSLRWASNLFVDSVMVTAAQTESGDKLVLAVPLASQGVTIGRHFDLVALGSTASSSIILDDVDVPGHQIIARDLTAFLDSVRPTFLVLQSALCVGLARRCLTEVESALVGINVALLGQFSSLRTDLAVIESRLHDFAARVGTASVPARRELLELRLAAAEAVSAAAALEIRTAGGRGYARGTDVSRRFREAAFIPVQSPSEAQLRWELRTTH